MWFLSISWDMVYTYGCVQIRKDPNCIWTCPHLDCKPQCSIPDIKKNVFCVNHFLSIIVITETYWHAKYKLSFSDSFMLAISFPLVHDCRFKNCDVNVPSGVGQTRVSAPLHFDRLCISVIVFNCYNSILCSAPSICT